MKVTENLSPPPPVPPRTFNLTDVSEEEMQHLYDAIRVVPADPCNWDIYRKLKLALGYY